MTKHFAGAKIRTLRRQHELTQTDMAARLGMSTSYLNQLENDQRPLTVAVLLSLTGTFDVDTSFFSGDREAATVAELAEAFPLVPGTELADLAARYPTLVDDLLTRTRETTGDGLNPYERVRDYFFDARNYIHELDTAAEELAGSLGRQQFRVSRLAALFDEKFGVTVRFHGPTDGPRRHFDHLNRELTLRTGLTEAQQCFQLALQYALTRHRDLLGELSAMLPDDGSRDLAALGLAQYFAGAVTMPYTEFLDYAEQVRYDIDLVAERFGTSFESTCHRLSTLQRPGSRGVPLFFIRTDRAGNISKRQSATRFHFSRRGGSCPLWVLHRAFETPSRITRQVAAMPDGHHYLWVARYVSGATSGFGRPRKEFAVALGCDLDQAHRLIYSDGLELTSQAATPIGPGCTACPRTSCPQRAFPATGHGIGVDFNVSHEAPYVTGS
ncbi:helix-turn-helix domain-containing protein [Corynebacterium doosanense]|uniref:MerR family transcriptional regulator n=1 Tax=Corynebacterium doosanense CAU 212 = DSM 45436 TaxID=558173 RepID=A0A097IE57_9CORY|nr:short-chain fatty acyl-CoA regulator family protein [Corynebacterium doosanense]AIT60407.1 MerR family transcriptional regulator [Corynebacterium doosanense CAU 212 = DSM 45436]